MLNPMAFASSLTILTGVFYLLLYILGVVWREAFRFLFNAQFFGADVASLLPRDLTTSVFVGTLLVLIVVAWVFGYAWAWVYNRLAQVI
jgi:uncharacterized protein DUF5676